MITPESPVFETILEEARFITDGARNYGTPEENFSRIALCWSAILEINLTPEQVALCMIAMKVCREAHAHKHDNIVDIAGYARCLAELHREKPISVTDDDGKDIVSNCCCADITYYAPTIFSPPHCSKCGKACVKMFRSMFNLHKTEQTLCQTPQIPDPPQDVSDTDNTEDQQSCLCPPSPCPLHGWGSRNQESPHSTKHRKRSN